MAALVHVNDPVASECWKCQIHLSHDLCVTGPPPMLPVGRPTPVTRSRYPLTGVDPENAERARQAVLRAKRKWKPAWARST